MSMPGAFGAEITIVSKKILSLHEQPWRQVINRQENWPRAMCAGPVAKWIHSISAQSEHYISKVFSKFLVFTSKPFHCCASDG